MTFTYIDFSLSLLEDHEQILPILSSLLPLVGLLPKSGKLELSSHSLHSSSISLSGFPFSSSPQTYNSVQPSQSCRFAFSEHLIHGLRLLLRLYSHFTVMVILSTEAISHNIHLYLLYLHLSRDLWKYLFLTKHFDLQCDCNYTHTILHFSSNNIRVMILSMCPLNRSVITAFLMGSKLYGKC